MLQGLGDSQSLASVFRKASKDVFFGLVGNGSSFKGDVLADDLGEIFDALDFEGYPGKEQLVGEHTDTPYVYLAVVEVTLQHLG